MLLELHQRLPMLELSLFRNGTFVGANVVALLVTLAMFGVFFFMSLYMQNILGYSPMQAGAIFLPMTDADHPDRADRRAAVRPHRLALADGRRARPSSAISLVLFSRLGLDSTFWDIAPGARRRRDRHGARR